MTDLEENYNDLNYFETFFSEETIYIIRLKDVYEKWESGYMTELINHESDRDKRGIMCLHEVESFDDSDDNTNLIKNFFTKVHKIEEDKKKFYMGVFKST